MTDTTDTTSASGWVFYDGDCPVCTELARRFGRALQTAGFALVPFQSAWANAKLGLQPGEVPPAARVLTASGQTSEGADAMLFLAGRIWWARPFAWFGRWRAAKRWMRRGYVWFAARRRCIGGICGLPRPAVRPTDTPVSRQSRQRNDQHDALDLAGWLFPGRQSRAIFEVQDSNSGLEISVHTDEADSDVRFRAAKTLRWTTSSKLFPPLQTATGFLARGECGFSPSASNGCLDGMRLRINDWRASPLAVEHVRAAFFENPRLFPPGSIEFDHAPLMENVPHRWLRIESPVHGAAESTPRRSGPGIARPRPFVRFFDV